MKETRLDDNAALYQRRQEKTEKQKFKELNGKEKWQYFKDYYLRKLLATVVILSFVGYFLYTVLSPKPQNLLSVACANYSFEDDRINELEKEIGDYLKIDPENQEVLFDSTYYLTDQDITSAQKLAVLFAAQDLDVFIAPESKFSEYAFSGSLWSLSDKLPPDLISALSDKFYSSQLRQDEESIQDASGPSYVFGIYLSDTELFKGYPVEDPPVLGIVLSGQNTENAVQFIRYLFDL